MKRLLGRALVGLLFAAGLLYAADYAWLRLQIARHQGYDSISIDVVYQIPQKGNKAEYVAAEPQMQTCVRSLFPHQGAQPCWYLRRHTQQQINY